MDLFSLWRPILEISIIWWIIYVLFRLVQGTRAVQVLMGLILFLLVFEFANLLGLQSIKWLIERLLAIGVIALLIIFQPELRRGLARLGQNAMLSSMAKEGGILDEIVNACVLLSEKKIGALIAIQRDLGLRNYVESGVSLDSEVSSDLLLTLFHPQSLLHDGGVIIIENRVASCGSLFPLTLNTNVSRALGTRHRAAIGITEETDAVCIVVSEETGGISVSINGKLTRNLDGEALKRVMRNLIKPKVRKLSFIDLIKGFRNER